MIGTRIHPASPELLEKARPSNFILIRPTGVCRAELKVAVRSAADMYESIHDGGKETESAGTVRRCPTAGAPKKESNPSKAR